MTSSCGALLISVPVPPLLADATPLLSCSFSFLPRTFRAQGEENRGQNLNGEKPSRCSAHGRLFILNL
jgi:hypothetical protein